MYSIFFCLRPSLKHLLIVLFSSLLLVFFNQKSAKGQLPFEKLKTAYLFQFAQNISWPNEESIDSFTIVLLGHNPALEKELKEVANTRKLKDRPISIQQFHSIDQITEPYPQLIYVDETLGHFLPQIIDRLYSIPTLVITKESIFSDLIMINFVYKDDERSQISFELNSYAIEQRHNLKILPPLLLLGGTKVEVAEAYMRQEEALKHERETVEVYKAEIEQQKTIISEQTKSIHKQRSEIDSQEMEIAHQQELIDNQKKELSSLFDEVKQQRRTINANLEVLQTHQEEIKFHRERLQHQFEEIDERNQILEEQDSEIHAQQAHIEYQKDVLDKQAQKIDIQQYMLIISLIAIIAILGMLFFIYKGLHDKRIANRLLIEKNLEIEQQNEEIQTQTEMLIDSNRELEKLSIVASKTDNAIIIMDGEGMVEWVNPGFTKLTGYTLDDLKNTIGSNFIKISSYKRIATLFNHCIQKKESVSYEMPFKAKHSKELWLQTTLTPILNYKREIETIIAVSSDITDLKNAHRHLVQSEKMASIGVLTAGIAHEINNPINFVYAGVNSLKRDFQDLDTILEIIERVEKIPDNPDEIIKEIIQKKRDVEFNEAYHAAAQTLNDITLGTERISEIVRGLSNFSRSEKDTFSSINLNVIIEEVLVLLKSKYKNHIEIVKNLDKTLPDIECKVGKINQVILNVVNNAIDAIEGKGTITISTSTIENCCTVKVEDTGVGISEQSLSKIFDPFYTTKDVGKGVGLGLSIVYGIIEEHNGKIVAKSTLGVGTTFSITLPQKQGDVLVL